jgi:hypothetical protein
LDTAKDRGKAQAAGWKAQGDATISGVDDKAGELGPPIEWPSELDLFRDTEKAYKTKISTRGTIHIPKKAQDMFPFRPGDRMWVDVVRLPKRVAAWWGADQWALVFWGPISERARSRKKASRRYHGARPTHPV